MGAAISWPRRQRGGFLALGLVLLLARDCGTTEIGKLLADPGQYEGKTVRVKGEVKESVGILGLGGYQLDDGTGTLPVVTQTSGAPRTGARVGVEGTFRAAYTLGGRTGAVLLEKRRYEP